MGEKAFGNSQLIPAWIQSLANKPEQNSCLSTQNPSTAPQSNIFKKEKKEMTTKEESKQKKIECMHSYMHSKTYGKDSYLALSASREAYLQF